MNTNRWEQVDSVSDAPARGRPPIVLVPGEVRRRPCGSNETASSYVRSFAHTGRVDYHAGIRVIEGERWLYIWRDRG